MKFTSKSFGRTFDNELTEIPDIGNYEGGIPEGTDLVVYEKEKPEKAILLHGFDEVGMYDLNFKCAVYGFLKSTLVAE